MSLLQVLRDWNPVDRGLCVEEGILCVMMLGRCGFLMRVPTCTLAASFGRSYHLVVESDGNLVVITEAFRDFEQGPG